MAKKRYFSKGKDKPNKDPGSRKNEKNDKKYNPFDVHLNRVKHNVVGRKSKDDRGLPGVSRAKAMKKREKTLLQDYKQRYKSNVFIDKRIGEYDAKMDPEKKITMRIAAEKKRQFNRKSLFNLNDDEELTHGGVSLVDANLKEKFSFSDDEDDDDDMLDAKFVREQHFGGGDGFLTKRDESATDANDDGKHKSRKEWIDEIIAESKKKKAEFKKEKEEQDEAVAKLDLLFPSFMKIMVEHKLTDEDKAKAKRECEFRDYDTVLTELRFDRTGKARAVEKLKTPEEIVKEEHARLEALEADRVRRMMGKDSKPKPESRSADDLDDGFVLSKDDKFHLSYKDGKMLKDAQKGDDEDEEETDDEDEEETGDESGDEEEEESEDEENSGDDEEEDVDEEKDGSDDDESDKYSDILEGSDSDKEDKEEEADEAKTSKKSKPEAKPSNKEAGSDSDKEDKEEEADKAKTSKKSKPEAKLINKEAVIKKREMMEAAKKEIPYTIEVPQDYEAFWALLENRSPKEVSLILERMITCNHVSLGSTNHEKCDDIFTYILQTLQVLTDIDGYSPMAGVSEMLYIDPLIPHLHTLTQLRSATSAETLLKVIVEKYEDFGKMKFKRYPSASTFIFLKVCGLLFPASDFIHPVMTPTITFLTHLLGQAKVTTAREVLAALFTANLLMEYLAVSKRFVPELTNVLNGLVFLAIPDKNKRHLPLTQPFKYFQHSPHLLVLENEVTEFQESKLKFERLNSKETKPSDDFKINIICKVLRSLTKLCTCWSGLRSVRPIMDPTTRLLRSFKLDKYPECVKEAVEGLHEAIRKLPRQGLPLVKLNTKPPTMKMHEPAIEKVIEGVKKRHGTKEYLEKQKLMHKVKRERKAARRELQRDAAYMARVQLEETLQRDAERKRKLGQIMSGLQMQEGEYKKMKKNK